MTGQQCIWEAQVLCGESRSTAASQQSMLWAKHVRRSADMIARKTYTLKRHAVTDLIGNQVEYAMPQRPFQLISINIVDPQGNIRKLGSTDDMAADCDFYAWRTQPSQPVQSGNFTGIPAYYIPEGNQSYFLWPVPNYSVLSGLYVTGYYGVDDWWDMSQEQPWGTDSVNNEAYDEGIIHGGVVRRCREMKRLDPTYAQIMPDYQLSYQQFLDDRYGEALVANEADGSMIPSLGARYGSWGTGWNWAGF